MGSSRICSSLGIRCRVYRFMSLCIRSRLFIRSTKLNLSLNNRPFNKHMFSLSPNLNNLNPSLNNNNNSTNNNSNSRLSRLPPNANPNAR